MAYPHDDCAVILDTDASDVSLGITLPQVQDGRQRVIEYGRRTLNRTERNYCVIDKELLAVKNFTELHMHYLLSRRFTVWIDHQALRWLFRLREPKSRIARRIELLSLYDCAIENRPGSYHSNADAI